MKQQTQKTKIKLIKGKFSVNCPYTMGRQGNYELRDSIVNKWVNSIKPLSGCGNIAHEFYFDTKEQKYLFSKDFLHGDERYLSLYRIIPSALLLYRLICTFFGSPICYDNYKTVWEYNLTHKETGKAISFSEWKGAAGFWMADTDSNKLDPSFKQDLIELITYLTSNQCAHPYDNLVAGSVA